MVSNRAQGLGVLHSIIQYIAAAALLWIWRISSGYFYRYSEIQYDKIILYTVAISIGFGFHPLHAQERFLSILNASWREMLGYTLRQSLIAFSAITICVSATKDVAISRAFLFAYFPLLFCTLYLTNRRLPRLLSHYLFRGQRRQPTIIMGSAEQAQKYAHWLERKSAYGFHMTGFVHTSAADVPIQPNPLNIPSMGMFCDIENVLKSTKALQLILLELPAHEDIRFLSELCERLGVRLLIVNDLAYKLQKSICFMEDDGLSIMAFRQEPLESPVNRLLKRALDILISLPVVILILPITNCVVSVLQHLQAPGPLFFFQRRTGFRNEDFLIYKYRTMHVHHREETMQATADDPRIFPAGRWLRQHSIDELPQFINVLKGEMSIVGPRPHLPEHSHAFGHAAHGFKLRALIKPGITGLAQVEGFRGEVKELAHLTNRLRSDIYYLENWSLSLEWKIIAKTARQLVSPPRSAY